MKKIKTSKRGLTFSLEQQDAPIGAKYIYILDLNKQCVNIIYDENGTHTVSKKKCGSKIKPLFDLRGQDIKKLLNKADFLEIEVLEDKIIVHARKKAAICLFKKKEIKLDQVLGKEVGQIIIPLKMVSGDTFPITLDNYIQNSLTTDIPDNEINIIKKDINRIYDVVSLFSGAGLFDKAWLDTKRFHFVYANDFCKDVQETYEYNIGKHFHLEDIRNINISDIPDSDVTIGGVCCQAYSNANRRNITSNDAKQKRLLVEDYARLVKSKVFVVENVPQILTKEQGLYFEKLCNILSDYHITATVVTDSEVGGYSERKRAIIIGSKIGEIKLPDVKILTPKTVREALNKVDATWYNYNDITKPSESTIKTMSYVPQGGNWQDVPSHIHKFGPATQSNIYRRLELDKPSITLANFRKAQIIHPIYNRTLSVAEAASIMGLEKDFRLFGNLSAKQQMVANGVTQAIGKLVANTVAKALDKYYNNLCLQ